MSTVPVPRHAVLDKQLHDLATACQPRVCKSFIDIYIKNELLRYPARHCHPFVDCERFRRL